MKSSARRPEETRIAVFAKAPVAGEVKTRLVPILGAEGAARLHAQLVRRALATAIESNVGPVELWCAPDASHPFFASCAEEFAVPVFAQAGRDLGERMRNAFDTAFANASALVIVGSDCPALDRDRLASAAAALRSHDAVLVPAEDGGYVLIALTQPVPGLFDGIAWGSAEVLAATRSRLAAAGVRRVEQPPLWDVDRAEDYSRLVETGWLDRVQA
ncbi:MAG: TIGR04282 family arsenosugar biosynthesis glycosyltransferase [Bacillota bacterium]